MWLLTLVSAAVVVTCLWAESTNPNALVAPKESCTDGWDAVDGIAGKCFIVEDARPSWSDAQQNCIRLGGDLAFIESDEQNRLLSKYIVRKGFPKEDKQDVAIGLSRRNEQSSWTWTNGKPLGYKNGPLDYPRDIAWGSSDCVYLHLKGAAPYEWVNRFCAPPAEASVVGPPASLCERNS